MEVMVTTAVLALGMVMVFHSFFISLDNSVYLLNRLNASLNISNKIWESQDSLRRSTNLYSMPGSSGGVPSPKAYSCVAYPNVLNSEYGLYELKVTCSWQENARTVSLSRSAYVVRM